MSTATQVSAEPRTKWLTPSGLRLPEAGRCDTIYGYYDESKERASEVGQILGAADHGDTEDGRLASAGTRMVDPWRGLSAASFGTRDVSNARASSHLDPAIDQMA